MKLPIVQRFQIQNYPGAPDWFKRFLTDMNLFTETVWNILNKNLTVTDNLDAQFYTFTLTAGAAAANNTTSFTTTIKHVPNFVKVGYAIPTASYSTPLTGVDVAWTYSGGTISINAISGLTNGVQYSITLFII